ncbi:two-component system sensor histidine kinase NtrB [Paraliobacillus sediminis]|uniref:two-component system sensor histidine kinase NtrB n=1 Tax=Paraliobacillus sediminis TaxID=1885916 RepID=UPI0013C31DB7|nr:ATP-binding protein [Paraliobacillus sediminis]
MTILQKSYKWLIILTGCSVFFLHPVFTASLDINDWKEWRLIILLIVSLLLAYRYIIILPPNGNSFSLDSSIYIASVFIFGINVTLLILLCSSLVLATYVSHRQTKWYDQLFNLATYTIMISTSYYVFILTGGELGYIDIENAVSYLLAIISYGLINIIIVGCVFLARYEYRLYALLKDILVEAIPNYLIIYLLAFVLISLLELYAIFGLALFTIMIVAFSFVLKKYFELYEQVYNDKIYIDQIMSALTIGMLTLNDETGEIILNDAAAIILKKSKAEISDLLLSDTSMSENHSFWRIVRNKKNILNKKVLYKTEIKTYVLLVSQTELINHSNEVSSRVFQFLDITESDAIEKRMSQSEKLAMLGELSAGAAHEIRNPLTIIKGFMSLMNVSLSEKEQEKFHVSFMLNELDRINYIVEDMLKLAKPTEPEVSETDIKVIIEAFINNYKDSAGADKIQFELLLDNAQVMVDHKQLQQVFYNLIRNSTESMGHVGIIRMVSKVKYGQYHLYIEDTGNGIPVELQSSIFKPFMTNKDTGTGLGLSIIKRIIESHQGEISMESSSEKGSIFLITLPIVR